MSEPNTQPQALPPDELDEALSALERGDVAAALPILWRYAESGYGPAMSALGLLYARGDGVLQDFAASVTLFQRAAEKADPDGLYFLGYAHLMGSGLPVDEEQALAHFVLAAARGHQEAAAERDRGLAKSSEELINAALGRARSSEIGVPAGWLGCVKTGVKLWLPSIYRCGTYHMTLDVADVDGFADGQGDAYLVGSQPGEDDRHMEGRFHRGYYYGEEVLPNPVEFLPTNGYLIQLPFDMQGESDGITLWLLNDFDLRLDVRICSYQPRGLSLVVPDTFPIRDEFRVQGTIRDAAKTYRQFCRDNRFVSVDIVPANHVRTARYGDIYLEPRWAEASVQIQDSPEFDLHHYTNFILEAERKQAQKEARHAEKQAMHEAHVDAATRHDTLAVRGARLGMTYEEAWTLFAEEIAVAERRWREPENVLPFRGASGAIHFEDGATMELSFASAVNGSRLHECVFEQWLSDGTTVDALIEQLKGQYGEPDSLDTRWKSLGYAQISALEDAEAAFVISYETDYDTGLVRVLKIRVADIEFGRKDERDRVMAEREAMRQALLAKKSGEDPA